MAIPRHVTTICDTKVPGRLHKWQQGPVTVNREWSVLLGQVPRNGCHLALEAFRIKLRPFSQLAMAKAAADKNADPSDLVGLLQVRPM